MRFGRLLRFEQRRLLRAGRGPDRRPRHRPRRGHRRLSIRVLLLEIPSG